VHAPAADPRQGGVAILDHLRGDAALVEAGRVVHRLGGELGELIVWLAEAEKIAAKAAAKVASDTSLTD